MEDKKRGIIKIISIIIVSIVVGLVLELSFNYSVLTSDRNMTSIDLSQCQLNGAVYENGSIIVKDSEATISMEFEEQYVERLFFEYTSEDTTPFNAVFKFTVKNNYDKYEQKEYTYDNNNVIPYSNISVRDEVSKIDITLSNMSNKVITQISLDNRFVFNVLRFGFFTALISIIMFIILFRKLISKKLEIGFVVISLVAGTCMIMLQPISINSWDSQIHFESAYTNSYIGEVGQYKSPIYIKNLLIDKGDGNSYLDKKTWIGYTNANNVEFNDEQSFLQKSTNINAIAYLTQSFGLFLGRTLNLPFYFTFILGQFCNLLQYSIIMYFAIKFMVKWKTLMFAIGLLPTAVFLASNYSYDPFINALLMLYISLFIGEYLQPDKKIKLSKFITMLGLVIIGSFPKVVYIPLALLLLLLPKSKFDFKFSRKKMYVILMCGMVLFGILLILNSLIGANYSGDLRGGDVSTIGQIKSVILHPFSYFNTLYIDNIFGKFVDYIISDGLLVNMAYLATDKIAWFTAILLMAFLTITDNYDYTNNKLKVNGFNIKTKAFIAVVLLIIMSLIWTSLYVGFTPVGMDIINGVQPRYYIPILILIYLLFNTSKVKCEIKQTTYAIFTTSVSTYILFSSIYNQLLLKFAM